MKSYGLTGRKIGRLFLKTAHGILILCTLLLEPVAAQLANPGRASGGRPDLTGIPANEARAIENACDTIRRYQDPVSTINAFSANLARYKGPAVVQTLVEYQRMRQRQLKTPVIPRGDTKD